MFYANRKTELVFNKASKRHNKSNSFQYNCRLVPNVLGKFSATLALGATFCGSCNLGQLWPFLVTFEQNIGLGTYQARKSQRFHRKLLVR